MPQNKDQLLRYKVLNECFRNTSRLYDINALVECCQKEMMEVYEKSVSKRSVQNDVRLLQFPPYNVEFDEVLLKQHYYRYADTTFNLGIVSVLTKRERSALHDTIELLRPMCEDADTANPLMQWMYMSLQRMEEGKPLGPETACVFFENNDLLAGMGNFNFILECIMNRQPIILRYKSFHSAKISDIKIHPYALKQYNGRWYIIALPDRYKYIVPYAIDRVLSVEVWKVPYVPANTDVKEMFNDMIGVTIKPEAKTERIKLKVAAKRYPYIETKPFSEMQKVVERNEEWCTIVFPMKVTRELEAEILSYGADIEVLEPLSLRINITHQIQELFAKYNSVQKNCTLD